METKRLLSEIEKNRNKKQWYKDSIDSFIQINFFSQDEDSSRSNKNLKVNYNLFNGIIDKKDFEYIYKPLGEETGDLPADFTNKDIISGKMKVLLGMELERPFAWRINAVNPEATTRKETAKFDKYREYVIQQIMSPIQEQAEMKYAEQTKGSDLSKEEKDKISKVIQQEIQAMTPPEVDHYMKRKHQDPAEIAMSQIFKYTIKEQKIQEKFNTGWKHSIISAAQIYWSGIINGKPVLKVVNPLDFYGDNLSEGDYIQDGEYAGVDLWLSPTAIIEMFDTLTDDEIRTIYELGTNGSSADELSFDNENQINKIKVIHRTWKAIKQIGFLSYIDPETMTVEERIVDEGYRLNEEAGDVNIVWQNIPEVYEGYKIGHDIYKNLRPVPSQPKDMDNLYNVKLPYSGGFVDNMNSEATSLVDRIKLYQYYYNIIMYRIEMLMASDKGKILLLNMNLIPTSQKIGMKKFLAYLDKIKIGFMNPNEEGNRNGATEVATAAKEIDMSLISDIEKYIKLAEYIEARAGNAIGVTKEMEGRFGQYQAVKNAEQAIQQGSYIIEPYFDWHNNIKTATLTYFLELSAVAYSTNDIEALDYILDDFSREIIKVDKDLLSLSKFGFFVANSMDSVKVKEALNNLGLTAMQNQTIDMSDIVKIMKTDSITEAEELLEVAEERKRKETNAMEQQRLTHEKELKTLEDENAEKEHQRAKELVVLKAEEDRKTEIQKQTILALGFAENKDVNNNDVPDVLEVAKFGVDAELKIKKQKLDEDKFKHQKTQDKEKNTIEKKKLNKQPSGS